MARTVTWLHLSDLHSCKTKTGWDADRILTALRRDLQLMQEKHDLRPDLIFFTGDAAYGQKTDEGIFIQEQFDEATLFLSEICSICSVPSQNLFLVPGNHDVNRETCSISADSLLKADNKPKQVNQLINDCGSDWRVQMSRLTEYRKFLHGIGNGDLLQNPERLVYATKRDVNGITVGIAGLNSAWSCFGNQPKGALWLGGEWQIQELMKKLRGVELRIGLIHHPPSWFAEEELTLWKQFPANFHFLLHGHEHDGWVSSVDRMCRIAAGACYGASPSESGYSFVRLDLDKPCADIWVRRYGDKVDKWLPEPHRNSGDDGKSTLEILPWLPVPQVGTANPQGPESRGIFGRAEEIRKLKTLIDQKRVVTVFGLSGIGKTKLIEEVRREQIQLGYSSHQFNLGERPTYENLFRELAPALGCHDEDPQVPDKLFDKIDFSVLKKFAKHAQPTVVFISNAQKVFTADGFNSLDVAGLFKAIIEFAPQVRLILESRERPPDNIFPAEVYEGFRVRGLTIGAVQEYFRRPFVEHPDIGWQFTQADAEEIWQRLGGKAGKGGDGAHPMGMFILASVASGMNETPMHALERHRESVFHELEEQLFNDLYLHVLDPRERRLLQLASMYRLPIPHTHIGSLNAAVGSQDGFDKLVRRCLLMPDDQSEHYEVHSLISELTLRQIDFKSAQFLADHEAIADAWLNLFKTGRHVSRPFIIATAEAAYHLIQGECHHRLKELSTQLLARRPDIVEFLDERSRRLHAARNYEDNLSVLQVLVAIEPRSHKHHRFLGESIDHLRGKGTDEAFEHHDQAFRIAPARPEYAANLGSALVARGKPQAFLDAISELTPETRSQAMNDAVVSVYCTCLGRLGRTDEASKLRQARIRDGCRHAPIFHEEIMFQAHAGDHNESLRLFDIAEKVGAIDDQLEAAKAGVLSRKGDTQDATELRNQLIKRNIRVASVYNDEASAMLAQGRTGEALAMVERAKTLGCLDDTTVLIHAGILQTGGQPDEASNLRKDRLAEPGLHEPILFNAEAVYLRNSKRYADALTLLERAEKLRCTNLHLLTTKSSILELMGRGPEASTIRQAEIQRGARDPFLYNEEAAYLCHHARPQEALVIIELAEANLCANDLTQRIKADIQQSAGDTEQATKTRRELIQQGTTNPAVYADEAMALARRREFTEAFQVLQLAAKTGVADDYTLVAKATILDMAGMREDASRFRRKVIDAGRRNVVFYNDEAVNLRDTGDLDGAIVLLNKAEQLGISNEYTATIRADILSRMGHADAASKIRRDWIAKGSRHAAFYHMEAIHLSETGHLAEGLALLDKVAKMGVANRYTETIHRKLSAS